jgi:hypothetical protein
LSKAGKPFKKYFVLAYFQGFKGGLVPVGNMFLSGTRGVFKIRPRLIQ